MAKPSRKQPAEKPSAPASMRSRIIPRLLLALVVAAGAVWIFQSHNGAYPIASAENAPNPGPEWHFERAFGTRQGPYRELCVYPITPRSKKRVWWKVDGVSRDGELAGLDEPEVLVHGFENPKGDSMLLIYSKMPEPADFDLKMPEPKDEPKSATPKNAAEPKSSAP